MEIYDIVLFLLVILVSVYGKLIIVGPVDPVTVIAGEDAMLECQLVPGIFPSNMAVRWFKSGLDSPVHMYRNGEDDIVVQHEDYRGRTELFKDELTKGNISLRIKQAILSDRGKYTCSVDDKTDSETSSVTLEVVGFGCEPWIQMKASNINEIQLVCKSTGWFPEPRIYWVPEDEDNLIQAETTSHQDSTGLVDIQSSIVITRQPSNRFTCHVRNEHLKTEQEVTIRISGDIFPSAPVWLAPLLVTICLLIVAITAVIYWNLKQHLHIKEWKRICECEAPVTLDPNTAHPALLLSEDLSTVRDTGKRQQLPDNPERFDCYIDVLGSEGFISGKHSWEVEVGNKTQWNMGVAKESINRKEGVSILTPGNGFWTLALKEGNKYWAGEEPWKHLELKVKPRKIRVCLDYEGGKVSFYNSENKTHIYTFTGTFIDKLYPFFCPGLIDGGKNSEPLKICPRRVTIQEDEELFPLSK
ncbi:butyrophilin subfamily 1 member A1-like isoform X2 [Chiloscyllium plagiosum]|uniref:butyrophilin subfamily 1 member A1-like isoform X2 n=1 Tax=Chiloscyllium plagiosum TaxID=36176 RepID=UPI001CB8425B|nr:butyrophilin subfamily 1 member A1-like isoform X2 [Chiloscyllium plagiosum]